jgi:acyl-CoA synthetase (AMP-forming)/AMP-acid ligase II
MDSFLPNGFFRAGDGGFLDLEGYLTLVGRNSEIINRGGEKISPIEVDAALGCSPAIREAICFSVPDALMGQEVEAVVVLAERGIWMRRLCRRSWDVCSQNPKTYPFRGRRDS